MTTAGDVIRRLVAPVYLPITAGTIGAAMLIPVLPLYLDDVGLSLRATAIVLASAGVGATLGGLPSGALIARFGERRVMFASLIVTAVAFAAIGVVEVVLALITLRAAAGASSIALRLSRQTYITRRVEPAMRGRAMASIGGAFRVALLVGPILGGVIADAFGFTAAFLAAGALTALGTVSPLLRPVDPPLNEAARRAASATADGSAPTTGQVLRSNGRRLAIAGVVPMLTLTVRDGRFVVLPLIGDELGLSPAAIGAVVTAGTAADLLLFPAAGYVMDRFGRLAAIVPAFTLVGSGLVMLGFVSTPAGVVVAGIVIGVGNGLASGSMLTLGSDLAPPEQPGPFLAAFGTMQDVGKILGPLVVGFVAAAADLSTAAYVLAGLIAFTAIWLVTMVGETSHRRANPLDTEPDLATR